MNQFSKLALEAGPLIIFFVANATTNLITATAIFVAATLASLALSWALLRKVPVMPLVGGVFVVVFGGLTVFLGDDLFIKIKPTIVNLLFAAILFVGLATGRLFIKLVLESALAMSEAGWRALTWRWAIFFVVLAIINEAVWRNFSSDTWVAFKVWGMMPLTIVFSAAQIPLLLRHQLPAPPAGPEGDGRA
ncbi:septation protein A [Rhodospirillum rubrum]|uniref:Inner membrane-spanning protein YciB n=1 Tax=Rhodospirillum rubrum (strain ATCC 11170 / ATH 1.1.1 / DSM 467 / LMG 4362 / NCIMB 8255 / S1) TaxID=269796 RepID=Q2RQZ3_RHORT|nr:septation protein A [Rhodospirillum rubrum]ABC23452.1 Intracellular septation protein A [Rhodospirillum rubrum ATCC 11170]AEO49190.1 intracellular septation protein A [Rhodospirillum rubrum F11]MBK5955122.1 septation protein A [Rhodospirillum rubrum]QXG79423.1 septation protein A [Rhodospirillum rubrum]